MIDDYEYKVLCVKNNMITAVEVRKIKKDECSQEAADTDE